MKTCALISIFSFLLISNCAFAQQGAALERYDYSAIGLSFSVPRAWVHDGLTTTTKAAFIKQFGWTYDRPDAGDIWSAVGSFSSVEVDSSLIPSDSAYTMHRFTIFVSRSNTLYKQWLCRHHRSSLFEARPLVNENDYLLRENRIGPFELPGGLSGAHGSSYTYFTRGSGLPTIGHFFAFVHQDRCFELKLESTSAHLSRNARLHQSILNSVKRYPF